MMETNIPFEAMPQAIQDLLLKVDSLQNEIRDMRNQCNKPVEESMIGINEACEMIGLAKSTVYALASAHKIPHYQPGKMLKFKRSELQDWMENGRQKTIIQTTDSLIEEMQKVTRRKPRSNFGR